MAKELNMKIDPKLVAAFVDSTENILSIMANVECRIGTPYFKTSKQPTYDVSGIVGFSGDVAGSVVVSFNEDTAIVVVEAFAGEKLDVKSEDFADAIGELCNMIAGNAKKHFGLNAYISIPSVIVGSGHTVARLKDTPCIVIPCTTKHGEFAVEVNIKQLVRVTA